MIIQPFVENVIWHGFINLPEWSPAAKAYVEGTQTGNQYSTIPGN